jgi:hypothetical protein
MPVLEAGAFFDATLAPPDKCEAVREADAAAVSVGVFAFRGARNPGDPARALHIFAPENGAPREFGVRGTWCILVSLQSGSNAPICPVGP